MIYKDDEYFLWSGFPSLSIVDYIQDYGRVLLILEDDVQGYGYVEGLNILPHYSINLLKMKDLFSDRYYTHVPYYLVTLVE